MTEYNTKYAFPVDIGDYSIFKTVYEQLIPKQQFPVYRHKVGPELIEFKNKFEWLGDYVDYFLLYPGTAIGIHVDGYDGDPFRAVVLNIPVQNAESTTTSWHTMPAETEWKNPWLDGSGAYKGGNAIFVKSAPSNIIEYSLKTTEPIIFNTHIPHSVKNRGPGIRIMASWHTKFDTYEQARTYFNIPISDSN